MIQTFACTETERFFAAGKSRRLPAIHPGEFLREILNGMNISQAEFARAIGVSSMRISHVIKKNTSGDGRAGFAVWSSLRPVSAILAQPAGFYDLINTEAAIGERLAGVHSFAHV